MDGTFCERPERPTPTCQESKAGDTAAFQEIVIVKQPLVLRVAQRLLLNAEDAKDAAQEVFIRLHHTLHRFDAEQEIGPWLYTSGQGSSDTVTKIIHVRYADPGRLADLVGLGLPIRIDADRTLKVIVVKGPPTLVTSVEQTIHELDVPSTAVARPRDVELIVSVIGGSSATETATAAQPSDDLGPVIKQLRAIFPYKNYQLLSSMLLRSREGTHATNNGLMKNLGNTNYSRPSSYVVGFDAAEVFRRAESRTSMCITFASRRAYRF